MRVSSAQLAAIGYHPDGTRMDNTQCTVGRSSESERTLHARILDHCRFFGWPVVHSRMDRPATSGVGTPDFVIAMHDGRTLWIEAKTATGKLTTEQAAWLAALRKNGHSAHVVRSLRQLKDIISGYIV